MKFFALSMVAAFSLLVFACGSSEEPPGPPPLPAPTQPSPPTPDVQATVEAGVQATVVAASLQATAEAQAAPTNTPMPEPPTSTPEPEPTPVPPTNTPEPEPTPVPPTNTPEPEPTSVPPTNTPEPEPTPAPPTSTPVPEPTSTPAPPPTPEPTPAATPNPVGLTWDRPVPIGEDYTLRNANELTLRVRENRVYWANDAWEIIDDVHPLNNEPPRGFEYLLIDIQVRGPNTDGSEYDASLRLTAEGAPPDGNAYRWSGANHCGGIPETRIKFDFALKRPDDTYGRRGNICFVVTRDDSGKLVLVDNGGPGAPEEDRRYFSLRR